MVTIEPGVYVPFDDAFPKEFRGIGIRVEDDIAVGEEGNVVLSSAAPKEVVDVEAACKRYLDKRETNERVAAYQPAL